MYSSQRKNLGVRENLFVPFTIVFECLISAKGMLEQDHESWWGATSYVNVMHEVELPSSNVSYLSLSWFELRMWLQL